MSIPHLNPPDNPNYFNFFYDALKPYGVTVHPDYEVSDKWLRAHADEIDVVHCHWPEYLWKGAGSLAREVKCLVGVRRFFSLVNRLGKTLVWTAHNHAPHEYRFFLDRIGYGFLASRADLIIAHSEWSKHELLRRYPVRGDVVVMPHGSYAGVTLKPQLTRENTLHLLGFETDMPLLACLGSIRPYKGLELAIKVVKNECPDTQLLIAGKSDDRKYLKHIEMKASGCNRIRVIGGFMPPGQLADFISAGDLILLPYKRITTSAALVHAWSYGKAVVVSPLPYFEEMLKGREGYFADGYSSSAFGNAVRQALSVPMADRRSASLQRADDLKWDKVVKAVATAFRALGRK